MVYYRDFREYLGVLEKRDKIFRVKKRVLKETELMPLVRLQFRGLPESDRRAFLFENVADVKGREYDSQVAVATYAASREIYSIGMMCEPNKIREKWSNALLHPIKPNIVNSGPVQEETHTGPELLEDGKGLEELPVPVELPGFSGQIRTTTQFITKDPETGVRNCGTYSGHIFAKDRILWEIVRSNHGFIHWKKAKELGKSLPAAIVAGATPNIAFVASSKIPYGVDEFDIAGGLSGEPVELVKCKTVDLEVPATAEVVIEGIVSTEYMDPSTPFGEFTGFMAVEERARPVFQVTCITHRRKPIFNMLISQMPPSESSKIREIGMENSFYKFLKYDCNIPGILDVAFYESGGSRNFCVIKLRKTHPSHPWQALNCAVGFDSAMGKILVTVDEDIDIRDPHAVIWALSYRMQPHRDTRITRGKTPTLDPSAVPPGSTPEERTYPDFQGTSAILIDATIKWPYPPVALPKKEYMEKARKIWEEEHLPKLTLHEPWYGYPLGYWPKEYEEDAELILKGDHYKLGEKLASKRTKV